MRCLRLLPLACLTAAALLALLPASAGCSSLKTADDTPGVEGGEPDGDVDPRNEAGTDGGGADELASAVVELLVNTYANGEVLRVDGGARLQPK